MPDIAYVDSILAQQPPPYAMREMEQAWNAIGDRLTELVNHATNAASSPEVQHGIELAAGMTALYALWYIGKRYFHNHHHHGTAYRH